METMSRLTKISWVHKNGHRHSHRVSARWPPNGLRRQTTHKNIRNIIVNNKNRFIFIILFVGSLSWMLCWLLEGSRSSFFYTTVSVTCAKPLRKIVLFFYGKILSFFSCGDSERYKCSRSHQMLCFMMASSPSPPPFSNNLRTSNIWSASSRISVSRINRMPRAHTHT